VQGSEPLPESIGRYQVETEIGRGMMGAVYKAYDPLLGRPVAIKIIRLAFPVSDAQLEEFETRFMAEGQIVARLSHPGIVTVHDVGRDEALGGPYLALEYLVGRTLSTILDEDGPLDWAESLRIVARVARTLDYAHRQQVVHRDIKPANIMILEDGEPKVMDFGIARLKQGSGLTSTGQFMGTPLYMSPEQALGNPVDGRSDLFSLGSIAYTLLAHRPAFEAEAVPVVLNRVAYQAPPTPASLNAGLPPALDYVLNRALAKLPEGRYPDGASFADDLEDVLAGRSPRHEAGWTPQVVTPSGTLVSSSEPALVSPTQAQSAPISMQQQPGGHEVKASDAEARPVRARTRRIGRRLVFLSASLLVLAATVYFSDFWYPRLRAIAESGGTEQERAELAAAIEVASQEARSRAKAAAERLAAMAERRPSRDADTPPPAGEVAPDSSSDTLVSEVVVPWPGGTGGSSAQGVRLSISLEHRLERGAATLWVDDDRVFRAALQRRSRPQLLIFKTQQGGLRGVLPLQPGEHRIRFEVLTVGGERTESIVADFEPHQSRHLDVSVRSEAEAPVLAWRTQRSQPDNPGTAVQ